jgi:hypothetical protein
MGKQQASSTKPMVTTQKAFGSSPTGSPPSTSTWLTRNEASDMLMISTQTLANYERRGLLHPQHAYRPDHRGVEHRVVVYDPNELKKVPRYNRGGISPREPGEVAARAFELFREGKTVEVAVIELRETPDKIHELRDKWLDAGGADFVITPEAKAAFEKIVGPFTSVVELLEIVSKKLAAYS